MDAHEQALTDKEALVAATTRLTAMSAADARDRRTQLFLKRVQDAAVAAGKSTVRLRFQPQCYDPVKNVYVAWPDRGWNVNLHGVLDALPVLDLVDRLLDLLTTEGLDGTQALLDAVEKKRKK